ncbi:late embryogenesis abundant protein [Senna tora]|uniref:Late embryogenesis abundant protein n=1 Tax=Senna tora TaxID=362788 RepID=A0A834TY15_9FABA|nr:late embryogenesis abundant protein [Senna tora]
MEGTKEAIPLAPAAGNDYDNTARRRRLKCCGCVTIFLLLLIILIIILIFTVFKVKDPKIKMNGIEVTNLDLNVNSRLQIRANMSLVADMSIKNPNAASFKFGNTTTTIYYHDTAVAEVRGPPGRAKARGTARMNVTVDVMADRLVGSSDFLREVSGGSLMMNSYSVVPGRVNVMNIVKKHVVVKMNCTITIDISTKSIKDMICKHKVKI